MGRRSTLELLRTLRRRDREQQGRALASAIRKSDSAERAARAASAAQAVARSKQERAHDSARAHVDSGQATAGELLQAHRGLRVAEERFVELEAEARRAEQRAARADAERSRAASAFARADAARSLVDDHLGERAARVRERGERREEEAIGDHLNASAASRRSRGGA